MADEKRWLQEEEQRWWEHDGAKGWERVLKEQLRIMKARLSQMKEHLRVHVDHVARLWDLGTSQKTLLEEQKERRFHNLIQNLERNIPVFCCRGFQRSQSGSRGCSTCTSPAKSPGH